MMTVARSAFVAMIFLAVIPQGVRAGQGPQHDARSCLVEVLTSEELPVGPPFYHTVKARLFVTPANQAAFETSVAHHFLADTAAATGAADLHAARGGASRLPAVLIEASQSGI